YEEKLPWLPAIGVTYDLGVDGPGLVMLILSGLIGVASVLASLGVRERVRTYFCLLLLAQASVNGAIVARDMFVLILFWGAAAIPLALLILGWGGGPAVRRAAAAWRLLGYWGLGTGVLAVGVLALYAATCCHRSWPRSPPSPSATPGSPHCGPRISATPVPTWRWFQAGSRYSAWRPFRRWASRAAS